MASGAGWVRPQINASEGPVDSGMRDESMEVPQLPYSHYGLVLVRKNPLAGC